MLVEYFVRRYGRRAGKNFRSIDKKTLDLLQNYDWPGNIRELQNVIERSVILNADSRRASVEQRPVLPNPGLAHCAGAPCQDAQYGLRRSERLRIELRQAPAYARAGGGR
jgi:transcriptional regulator with PAS, ATPase and Fis domain